MNEIRTYAAKIAGFPTVLYSARSPSKARVQCWQAYCSYNAVSFREFLKLRPSIRRVDDPPGIGVRILVAGLPATRVIGHGQYTHFMRDGSDVILCAHPADVTMESVPIRTSDPATDGAAERPF